MVGIPSTQSADRALNGATRVLLRVAVLVGMVVCGWLLGSGTGSAQQADEPGGTSDWVHVALVDDESSDPSVATDTVATDTSVPGEDSEGLLTPLANSGVGAVVPVDGVLRLPAQGPGLVLQAVEPLTEPLAHPVVRSVVQPVVDQVLATPAAQYSGDSAPPRAAQAVVAVSPAPAQPADQAVATPPGPVFSSPQLQHPAPITPSSGSTDLAADRITGSSATADNHSAPTPVPVNPLRTLGTTCPPGSTGATTAAPAAHAAMLSNGQATADRALGQSRLNTGAGSLPRCPGQQPTTSPD